MKHTQTRPPHIYSVMLREDISVDAHLQRIVIVCCVGQMHQRGECRAAECFAFHLSRRVDDLCRPLPVIDCKSSVIVCGQKVERTRYLVFFAEYAPLRAVGPQPVLCREAQKASERLIRQCRRVRLLAEIVTLYAVVHQRPEVACFRCLGLPFAYQALRVMGAFACRPIFLVKLRETVLHDRRHRLKHLVAQRIDVLRRIESYQSVALVSVDFVECH